MQRCDDHLYLLSYVVEVSVATVSQMMAFVVDVLEEVTLGLSMSVCLCSLFSPWKKKGKRMSIHPTLILDSIWKFGIVLVWSAIVENTNLSRAKLCPKP